VSRRGETHKSGRSRRRSDKAAARLTLEDDSVSAAWHYIVVADAGRHRYSISIG
jgi:hypothetical protein